MTPPVTKLGKVLEPRMGADFGEKAERLKSEAERSAKWGSTSPYPLPRAEGVIFRNASVKAGGARNLFRAPALVPAFTEALRLF